MEEADGWIKIPLCEAGLERKLSTGCVCFRSFVLLRGKLTFQIRARMGPRFWPRPRGDESTAQEAGPGGVGGKGTFPDLPRDGSSWCPASLLFPAWWTWGFTAPSLLARGLVRAARTLKCAERLESPDEQAACRSLFFPGERATGTSLKADPGGTLLLRSPPADLRGDTGHPMVVGWASWLPPAIPACVEVHPRGEQGRLCAGFGLREGECLLVKPQHPPELGPGARLGGSAALPCPLLGDGSQGHTPVTRGRWWPRRCPVIGGLLSWGPGGAGSWPCPARSWEHQREPGSPVCLCWGQGSGRGLCVSGPG